jgi:hypothetical protein
MRSYILFLLFININVLFSQKMDHGYILSSLFPDKNSIYTKGMKWVNSNTHEFSLDRHHRSCNFYLSRFGLSGKKEWEVVIDKKGLYEGVSFIHMNHDTLYAFFAINNFKDGASGNHRAHFLVKIDSLGKIVQEKKINDSIPYGFNSVFFGDNFIYVILFKSKVICEKYDYNFNLVDIIDNDLLISFLNDIKIFKSRKNYISVGPVNNMNEIHKHLQDKTMSYYAHQPQQECVKRMGNLEKDKKVYITQLPPERRVLLTAFDNDVLYFLMGHREKNSDYKLFSYKEETDELRLLTDTISRSLCYFKALGDKEYVFVASEIIYRDDRTGVKVEYPNIIYYVKNDKIITQFKFEFDNITNQFHILDKKLFIFKNDQTNNTMKVRVFDYEHGKFLE